MRVEKSNTESDLVIALKNDDARAFDKLFAEYGKRLYFFAIGYLKSKEEAEEVVQEVFLRIWRNRKQLKPDLSFRAYLFRIAYHYILEVFERLNRHQSFRQQLIDEAINFDDEANEQLNYEALLKLAESLIDQLPPRQKEVLLKRKKENIPVKEIAIQLGITPKTVERHLTEALKTIKNGLDKNKISTMLFFALFLRG